MADQTIHDLLMDARKVMDNPKLDSEGQVGKRRYKYSSLMSVLDVVMKPLVDRGIFLTQHIARSEDGWALVTEAWKGSDRAVLDERPIDMDCSPQDQGSRETYAKRYALCSAFCLVGQEDDDAQSQQATAKRTSGFVAKCRACGRRYSFESQEQYEQFLSSPGCMCCPSPDWAVE